jgi:hypothetical protein
LEKIEQFICNSYQLQAFIKKLLHKNKKAGNLKLPKILLYILSKELKSKKELVQILALQAVSTSFTSATGNCL